MLLGSPHLPAVAIPAGTAAEHLQHDSAQQHRQPPAAAESAADAHQLEAQWEAESLSAAQTASRLSLRQAEQTQTELEQASTAEPPAMAQGAANPSHRHQLEAAASVARVAEDSAAGPPLPDSPIASDQQAQLALSAEETMVRPGQSMPQATQSEPVRPSQCQRPRLRRMTRSSARASLASQSLISDAVSTAHGGRRAKRQAHAASSLQAVVEQPEADLAADSVLSSAAANPHQPLISHVPADAAADSSVSQQGKSQAMQEEGPQEADLASAPEGMNAPMAVECNTSYLAAATGEPCGVREHAQDRQLPQHSVRADASEAPQSTEMAPPGSSAAALAEYTAAPGPSIPSNSKVSSAPDGASQDSKRQQTQKGRSRAKRPPKPRQPSKKKHSSKPPESDENTNVNKAFQPDGQHESVSDALTKDGSASSPLFVAQGLADVQEQCGPLGTANGCSQPAK